MLQKTHIIYKSGITICSEKFNLPFFNKLYYKSMQKTFMLEETQHSLHHSCIPFYLGHIKNLLFPEIPASYKKKENLSLILKNAHRVVLGTTPPFRIYSNSI